MLTSHVQTACANQVTIPTSDVVIERRTGTSESYVAAALIPAGNAVTKSA